MVTGRNGGNVAHGLDLAGYSTGKSALARADYECCSATVRVRIISGHPFSEKRERKHLLDVKSEQAQIRSMLAQGRLCVDVPIDLQGLMGIDAPQEEKSREDTPFVWERTLRPVDYAFGALPPLADRIGSPVARFRTILTERERQEHLGQCLWETYPRAIIERLTGPNRPYKNGAAVSNGEKWVPKTKATAYQESLADIANRIGLKAGGGMSVNDDELDAAVCAVAGVAPQWALLYGQELEKEIRCRITEKLKQSTDRGDAPRGYLLLRCRYWSVIHLTRTVADRTTPPGVT